MVFKTCWTGFDKCTNIKYMIGFLNFMVESGILNDL